MVPRIGEIEGVVSYVLTVSRALRTQSVSEGGVRRIHSLRGSAILSGTPVPFAVTL